MRSALLLFLAGAAWLTATARGESIGLDAALRETWEHNPEIARDRADLDRAAGTRWVYRSRLLPRLRTEGQAGYQGDRGVGGKANIYAIARAELAQTVVDFSIPPNLRRGNLEVTISRQRLVQTVAQKLHEARLQFYVARVNRERAALLRGFAGRLDRIVSIQAELGRAGLAPERARVQAEIQRRSIDPAIFDCDAAANNAISNLRALLGRPSGAPSPEPLGTLGAENTSFDLAAAAREAVDQRPDLAGLRSSVSAFEEDRRIALAAYFPYVEIRLGVTGVPSDGSSGSTNPNALRAVDINQVNEFRYGVFFNWAAFDGGTAYGQSEVQRSLAGNVRVALARAEADIPRDLARLRANLVAIAGRRAGYSAALEAAGRVSTTTRELLGAGKATQLETLFAENGLLDAEQGLLFTRFEQSIAAAELDRITGRYVRFENANGKSGPLRQTGR